MSDLVQVVASGDPLARLKKHKITVLLVDDQKIIGEAVRKMLEGEDDITFHFCQDPKDALKMAAECKPTLILQDLIMPDIDGLTLVKFFRANKQTSRVPILVLSTKEEAAIKAEAFALGANDYMVKFPDKIEVLARIRYHSAGYIHLLERDEAYEKLKESQKVLQAELVEAANYVRSLLPEPVKGRVEAAWKFVPSTQLGGDSFGYHWLDDKHLALYLLDVCGHGVGAALLSISAMNVLRARTLSNTDFYDPGSVLGALNEAFPMEKQNNMFFTMWYGVYSIEERELRYASGGHPPAVLFSKNLNGKEEIQQLKTPGLVIGGMSGVTFKTLSCKVGTHNRLYLFSDGVYEIDKPDGSMLQLEEFIHLLEQPTEGGDADLERLFVYAKELHGKDRSLDDDFSIVRFVFG